MILPRRRRNDFPTRQFAAKLILLQCIIRSSPAAWGTGAMRSKTRRKNPADTNRIRQRIGHGAAFLPTLLLTLLLTLLPAFQSYRRNHVFDSRAVFGRYQGTI
jgi:hypothetical protein